MPRLPDVLARCQAQPAPALFLDTCSLLDVVRYAVRPNLNAHGVKSARHLLALSQASPPAVHLLVQEVVPTEWLRHIETTVKDVDAEILRAYELLDKLNEVGGLLDPAYRPSVFYRAGGLRMTAQLAQLSRLLLDASMLVEADMTCEHRAYLRCRAHQAPAAEKKPELMDCTIIEHYLEVCAHLPAAGPPRVFLSANSQDYGQPGGGGLREPLEGQFEGVGLRWAKNFSEAASLLGLLP